MASLQRVCFPQVRRGKIMMQRLCGFFAAMVLCAGVPALAHHSGAMFDRTKTVELTGTIKEYQFTNPHVWIEVMVTEPVNTRAVTHATKDAKESPAPVQWSIEGEGPAIMARMGLGPSVLKPGDKVTLKAHPLRDGRSGGSFISITLPNGKVIAPAHRP
jgi:hypothetical protein